MKKYLLVVAIFLFTAMTLAFATNKIVVGTDAIKPPFAFVSNESGKMVGHDLELLTKILENLGYDVEFKKIEWNNLIPSLQSNKIDVIAGAFSYNEERAKKVSYTEAIYVGGTRIVVLENNNTIKSMNDLKNKKIGVEKGTVQAKIAHDNANKIGEIVEFDGNNVYLSLKKRKVDAIIVDIAIASYYFNVVDDDVETKFVGDIIKNRAMGFAVNKQNTTLLKQINEELERLKKNGWYAKNYEKWFETVPYKEVYKKGAIYK